MSYEESPGDALPPPRADGPPPGVYRVSLDEPWPPEREPAGRAPRGWPARLAELVTARALTLAAAAVAFVALAGSSVAGSFGYTLQSAYSTSPGRVADINEAAQLESWVQIGLGAFAAALGVAGWRLARHGGVPAWVRDLAVAAVVVAVTAVVLHAVLLQRIAPVPTDQ